MSAYLVATLFCDGVACSVKCTGVYVTSVRRFAAKDGWVRRKVDGKMVDLCPRCALAVAQEAQVYTGSGDML